MQKGLSPFLTKVQDIITQTRKFISEDKPITVLGYQDLLNSETAINRYHDIVNYYNAVQDKFKDIDYLIFLLSEASSQVDTNLQDGVRYKRQLENTKNTLNNLKQALQDVLDKCWVTLRYYEKLI